MFLILRMMVNFVMNDSFYELKSVRNHEWDYFSPIIRVPTCLKRAQFWNDQYLVTSSCGSVVCLCKSRFCLSIYFTFKCVGSNLSRRLNWSLIAMFVSIYFKL
uniref:Uncharacterized protein n=1 Tax=Cacopsylla melanoneura TaxID=428564 RepID=A0A8D9EL89_9HEMI